MQGTHSCFLKVLLFLAFAAWLLGSATARSDDWPQWRGPNRDGVWPETGILTAIPESGLKLRWRVRIGSGYSGPVVAQGRVYVTDRQAQAEVERVLCFEEATGRLLWQHSYPCAYGDMEYGNGPRASPTVHDGKVYTFGTRGHLFCLDAAKGSVLWKKDLAPDCNASIPRYGASAAPLIEGELLIVCAGGQPNASVIAFDRRTGNERWRALKDRPAYSAPIAITAGGCRQVIVWTADTVTSFTPATGAIHWQIAYKATFDPAQAVASPVFYKDQLLCLAAWNRGSLMLKLDAEKPVATVLWKTRTKPTTSFSTPHFRDDYHFYAIENDGSLCCFDATTGKEIWATREPTSGRFGTAHLIAAGDRVFLFNHKGQLMLARLTPKGYEELGRCLLVEPTAGYRAAGAETWAHPAFANRCVFARNDKLLVCYSLAAGQAVDVTARKEPMKHRLLGSSDRNAALAFSPDGKTLATGAWDSVKLMNVADGKQLPAPARFNDWVCSVAFSPDGKLLVCTGGSEFKPARNGYTTSGDVRLWDVAAKAERGRLNGHTSKVFAAVFAPDGKTLATGSADRTIRLWDLATGKELAVLRGHSDAVSALAFSPDGKWLASASWDRTIKQWDTATGKERACLLGHDEEVLALAVAPNGTTLASGSGDWTARLWDWATGKQRATLKGHQGAVTSLAFSSDGKTLATGSGDETARLWDVVTGQERTTLRGHQSGIAAIAFSPRGRILASAGMDDAVRLWELPKAVASTELGDIKKAVERGLAFLENDAVKWRQKKQCATCHHGAMTVWALSEARHQGVSVRAETLADFAKWTKERLGNIDKPRDPRPGWKMVNTPALYLAMMALTVPSQSVISAEELKAVAGHLLRHQEADGSWAWSSAPPQNRPPPVFESDEVATLLAYVALGPEAVADSKAQSGVRQAREHAAAWLEKTRSSGTTQAAAIRLFREVRSGKPAKDVADATSRLLNMQNQDGGWGQDKGLTSDAYATGQALYFLRLAGVDRDRVEVHRAVAYLLARQKADGSWPMTSRAHPGAKPYTNPVPITYFGTAWATLGLLRTLPK